MINIKRMRNSLKSVRIKMLFLVYSFLIPLNVILLAISTYSTNLLKRQSLELIESKLYVQMSQLDTTMTDTENYATSLVVASKSLSSYLTSLDEDHKILAWSEFFHDLLYNVKSSDRVFGFFVIDTDSGRNMLIENTYDANYEMRTEIRNYLLEHYNGFSPQSWFPVEIGDSCYLARSMYEENVCIISLLFVDTFISNDGDSLQSQIYVSDTNTIDTDEKQLSVTAGSSVIPLYFHQIVSTKDLLESLPFIQGFMYVLVFCCIAAVPILFFLLRRILLDPIRQVNDAVNIIEKGDMDYRIPPSRSSYEFQRLNRALNHMTSQIQQLKIENYEKQISEQQVELHNLMLQVNPHFLLNSFNLIYQLAQLKEYISIQEFVTYLGNYFRYSFQGKTMATLGKEIELIKNYLKISEMRFPGQFTSRFYIDEHLLNYPIPPLLVQNFVENIIKHALQPNKVIQIIVTAWHKSNKVLVTISDNGCGIPQDLLEKMNSGHEKIHEGGKEHIGIRNSLKRLELFYGSVARLDIETSEGKGVTVRITLPDTGMVKGLEE